MKTKTILILMLMLWGGLTAQQIEVDITETQGNCLLQSDCEANTICYDLIISVDEPNWELRSYNIWVQYPSPPLLSYNSDNACFTQNGGDTDNNAYGQYRVAGVNGSFVMEQGIQHTFHSICFDYSDGSLILDSLIEIGGEAMVFGFPFESTITLKNTITNESVGINISSTSSTTIQLDNKQILDVETGWSGVSSCLVPNLTDIEYIMSPVIDDLVLMYNLTEGIFSPDNNINTINNWNYKSGYIIKVNNGAPLNICGTDPDNRDINLMAGWNIIPVLSKNDVPVDMVFDELGNNLVIVKEIAGFRIYYPEFSINSLSTLQPGKAYFVKVLEGCTITFPDQIDKSSDENQAYYFDLVSPWAPVTKTPESHVFCFEGNLAGKFETGDMIGAFDQAGNCAGIMEILDDKNAFAVSVFGDDQTTPQKDGLNQSELIAFTLFKTASGEAFNIDLAFRNDSPCDNHFVSNGISIVKDVLISTTGTGINNYLSGVDLQIYPNPTEGNTNFKLTGDVNIDGMLILTSSRGQLIQNTPCVHSGGVSFGQFDFSRYAPGVYYLRLVSDNYLNIQKIVVK